MSPEGLTNLNVFSTPENKTNFRQGTARGDFRTLEQAGVCLDTLQPIRIQYSPRPWYNIKVQPHFPNPPFRDWMEISSYLQLKAIFSS